VIITSLKTEAKASTVGGPNPESSSNENMESNQAELELVFDTTGARQRQASPPPEEPVPCLLVGAQELASPEPT
jgi:hypothetical protein